MKDLLKHSLYIFKKDMQIWLLAIVVYSLIMTIGLSLSTLLGFGNLLLIIFVTCPFIITFIKLAIKSIGGLPLDNKDVYLGYKDLSISISIVLKKIIVPILVSLLFYFFVFIITIYVYVFFLSGRELYDSIVNIIQTNKVVNIEEITSMLINNDKFIKDTMICNYVSIGITFIFINIIANKKILSMLFFMCIKSNTINYDFIVNNKKELRRYNLFLYNVFLSLFYVLAITLAILFNYLLIRLIDNTIIIYLLSSIIFFMVSSFVVPFKYISYTYIFNEHFNEDVGKLLEEKLRK